MLSLEKIASAMEKCSMRRESRRALHIPWTRNFDSGFCSSSSWGGGNSRAAANAAVKRHHRMVRSGSAAKRHQNRRARFQRTRRLKVNILQSGAYRDVCDLAAAGTTIAEGEILDMTPSGVTAIDVFRFMQRPGEYGFAEPSALELSRPRQDRISLSWAVSSKAEARLQGDGIFARRTKLPED